MPTYVVSWSEWPEGGISKTAAAHLLSHKQSKITFTGNSLSAEAFQTDSICMHRVSAFYIYQNVCHNTQWFPGHKANDASDYFWMIQHVEKLPWKGTVKSCREYRRAEAKRECVMRPKEAMHLAWYYIVYH